jgi:PPK2 family polyphosphate:nucleotide phosphotransferase
MDEKAFLSALNPDALVATPGRPIKLKDFDPGYTGQFTKDQARVYLESGIEELARQQDKLYAQNTYALLLIFQAMDAAGKDSTIKHVMSGINPQGCQVYSFKQPSAEELDHDYLWRCFKALPERGRIGIFNRSYYEEVLVVRVHREILAQQQLPGSARGKGIWAQRFQEINHFEQYLVNNGILVMKFFLHVSRQEQKKRFLERIELPEKNWKFSLGDVQERRFWPDYQAAYEEVFSHTSTAWAPWHIIPADHRWFTRLAVASLIIQRLKSLQLTYPVPQANHRQELEAARALLEAEEG